MTERIAVYPGSFDPLTNGHLDILARGRRLADRVIVAILDHDQKTPLFTVEERIHMIREIVGGDPSISVSSFTGLLVDFAMRSGATIIVRGLRAVSDYEYELQMALMNRRLAPAVETVFLMAKEGHSHVSSTLLRQVATFGGPLDKFLPPEVKEALIARVRERQANQQAQK